MAEGGAYERTSKSLKNSQVAIVVQILSLIVGFISRKVFIDILGTEILGLNTTATSILNFLNIAELGISSAIAVTLYKPIYDGDHKSIREIVALQGWLYKRVALFIIAASLILLPFFPRIFAKMELPMWYAYASFGVLLFSALLGYFVNYKQVMLAADQKDYKIQISFRLVMIVKVIFQIAAVCLLPNPYVWWLVLEAVFAIVAAIALNIAVYRDYPYMKERCTVDRELRMKYPDVITKVKQLFVHRLGTFAALQSLPIFIYAFTSLTMVAIYGNYMILFNSLQALLLALFTSITASVGNMIAEGDRNLIFKVFRELFTTRFYLVTFCAFGMLFLSGPFVELWLGQEYVLGGRTLWLMVALFFLNNLRTVVDIFINAYGIFKDIWAPIAEAVIFVICAIVLGRLYGLDGVLMAQGIELILIVFIWKPYFLFTHGMGREASSYFKLFFKLLAVSAAVFALGWWLTRFVRINAVSGAMPFLGYAAVICSVFAVILFVALYASESGMRTFVERLFKMSRRQRD
ncbi:MAG: sugar transporter [Bacteroidales bacterium]|nr:sugar transporter [Bacteroidales bacterium]